MGQPPKSLTRKRLARAERDENKIWAEMRRVFDECTVWELRFTPGLQKQVHDFLDPLLRRWSDEKRRTSFLVIAAVEVLNVLVESIKRREVEGGGEKKEE